MGCTEQEYIVFGKVFIVDVIILLEKVSVMKMFLTVKNGKILSRFTNGQKITDIVRILLSTESILMETMSRIIVGGQHGKNRQTTKGRNHEAYHTKRSSSNDAMWGTAGQNDVSARQDTGGILYGEEAEANILHL